MATELDQIVSVTITADSRTPSRQGFGTPLVMTYHTVFADAYKKYSRLSEMSTDGFTSNDHAYRMANSIWLQNPTVPQIVVGRLGSAPSFVTQLTMTSAVQGAHVRLKILAADAGTLTDPVVTGGTISPTGALTAGTVVTIDYVIQAAATTTTVATAVESLIEAVPGIASAPSSAVISITPVTAGKRPFVYDLENCTVEETTADAGYDTALTALELLDDTWYFVHIDSSSTANIMDVAAWTLSRKKIFFASTQSSAELAGTGTLGFDLDALGNNRTVLLYTANAHEFGAAGWVGGQAPKTPGSVTWAFKEIKGLTPKALTTSQRSALEADNINHYQTVAGLDITRPGVVTNGEFIDIIHGVDALEARIKEDVFALLAGTDKVPFTESGFALIESAIDAACQAFVGTDEQPGLLVKDSIEVIMPNLADISAADKAARRLTGIRFSADLAGAVHYTSITGTLSNA